MSYKNMMLLAVCLSELCLASLSVSANTITVTNTNDSGPNSLRQALAKANDGDTINFAVTGTIGLTKVRSLYMYFRGLRRDGRKVILRFTDDANRTIRLHTSKSTTVYYEIDGEIVEEWDA